MAAFTAMAYTPPITGTGIGAAWEVWYFPLPGGKREGPYFVAPGDEAAAKAAGGQKALESPIGARPMNWSPTTGGGGGTPPSPPGGTPPATPPVGGLPEVETKYNPFVAYLEALGLGKKDYLNPAEEYLKREYDPLANIYNVRRLMSTANPALNPGEYLGKWAAPFAGLSSELARNTLQNVFNFGPADWAKSALRFEPQFTGEEKMGETDLGSLRLLLQSGLRGNLGKYLAAGIPEQEQQWGSYQAGGGTNPFLKWLADKYNLGALIT